MATAPSTSDIRSWSSLDFPRYGYPATSAGDTKLEVQLARAESYIAYLTSRTYAQPQTDQFAMVKTVMDQAVQMRTEQVVMALASDQLETAADFDMIASFGAGSYNETRRSDVKSTGQNKPLNPWPALNDILWMLLGLFPGETNDGVLDQYDYWRYQLTGVTPPSWQTVEVDWGRGEGLNAGWWGTHLNAGLPGLQTPPLIGSDASFG